MKVFFDSRENLYPIKYEGFFKQGYYSSGSTIQAIGFLVGTTTANYLAVMYGPLHYRNVDMDKSEALKDSKGNFSPPLLRTCTGG